MTITLAWQVGNHHSGCQSLFLRVWWNQWRRAHVIAVTAEIMDHLSPSPCYQQDAKMIYFNRPGCCCATQNQCYSRWWEQWWSDDIILYRRLTRVNRTVDISPSVSSLFSNVLRNCLVQKTKHGFSVSTAILNERDFNLEKNVSFLLFVVNYHPN